jgi:hypothetical protein
MTAKRTERHPARAANGPKVGGNRSTGSTTKKSIPPPEEWDFSKVPENEILACFLYEFAREKARHSPFLKREFERLARGEIKPDLEWHESIYEDLRTSSGFAAPWHPEMLAVPWQSLPDRNREYLKKRASYVRSPTRADWTDAAFFSDTVPIDTMMEWEVERNAAAKFRRQKHPFYQFALSCRSVAYAIHEKEISGLESGCFVIDWNFPKGKIENCFKKWLNEKWRSQGQLKRLFASSGTKKAQSWLSKLKALAAVRLLDSGLSIPDAKKFAKSQRNWNIFEHPSEWSEARRTVEDTLQALFRFDRK